MRGLPRRIGFGDQRAPQPITRVHQTKEPLALAHTHLHGMAFPQTNAEGWPIPEIGVYLGGRRRLAHQTAHFRQLLGGKPGGPSGMVAFGQAGQAFPVEAPDPIDQGAGRVPKQSGDLLATQPGSDEQHAVQPVIVAGILMAVDFLLQQRAAVLRER